MSLDIVARAHSNAEVGYLWKCGANLTIMGERGSRAASVNMF